MLTRQAKGLKRYRAYMGSQMDCGDEVIRLNAMLDQIEVARLEENRERYGAA